MLSELRQAIGSIIGEYCVELSQKSELLHALARPGFSLHAESSCRAGVLVLESYRSIQGYLCDDAFRGAGGVELVMEACCMFDHVGDQEVNPEYGLRPAEELALAISLLATGIAAVNDAALSSHQDDRQSAFLNRYVLDFNSACTGQFLDTRLAAIGNSDSNEALRMTSLKAGSLGKSAAIFGACLAKGENDVVDLFGEFGLNLFTYLQLIDDIRDACPPNESNSDLAQRKSTVPLVFFYNSFGTSLIIEDISAACELYLESGAQVYAAVVAEAYLNRARNNLECLRDSVETVIGLEHLVNALEIAPQELLAGV